MKPGVKAALLSGIVFPGLGQMYLKRYRRGLFLMTLVLLGMIIVVGMATVAAVEGLKATHVAGGTIDVNAAANLATASLEHTGIYLKLTFLFVACCWIYAVIDAYRIGQKSDVKS